MLVNTCYSFFSLILADYLDDMYRDDRKIKNIKLRDCGVAVEVDYLLSDKFTLHSIYYIEVDSSGNGIGLSFEVLKVQTK